MLREQITEEEYEMLDTYRDNYAYLGEECYTSRKIPIKEIFAEWASEKETLYCLLGKQLKISKEFTYAVSEQELISRMTEFSMRYQDKPKQFGREQRTGYTFIKNFYSWTENYFNNMDFTYYSNKYNLQMLMSGRVLALNEYSSGDVPILLPNGKEYIIRKGCKPLRALSKLASAFNIEGFEDFRICHSLILNDKSLNGKLTLSIHPLDYWTMSDNECDWQSCMNWQNEGEFRLGTVEMMNSPYVIVVYLEAKEPMSMYGGGEWSNKKWRQLFIVDEEFICGIKSYPYSNDALARVALGWIADLAKENLGWEYDEEDFIWNNNQIRDNDGQIIDELTFSTGAMYCDMSYINSTFCRLRPSHKLSLNHFYYSGRCECVMCGDLDMEYNAENSLCCNYCDPQLYCSKCGNYIATGNEYYFHDQCFCEECYNDQVGRCTYCDDELWREDLYQIQVILEKTDIHTYVVLSGWYGLCSDCFAEIQSQIPIYDNEYVYLDDLVKIGKEYIIEDWNVDRLKNGNWRTHLHDWAKVEKTLYLDDEDEFEDEEEI